MADPEPVVSQFMTETPATADRGLRLSEARDRMFIDHIRHLVVLDEDRLCGVLSSRDISLALSIQGVDPKNITVADAMTSSPYTCLPTTSLSEVAGEMEAHGYGCVIVTDGGDEVLGVFTTTDALRALRQVVTGRPAEPLTASDHLRPTTASETRPYRVRRHRPIDSGTARVFTPA